MKNDFEIGMKVSLDGEYGVVVHSELDQPNFIGMIRWDTNSKSDLESWNGLFGTFMQNGGKILDDNYEFEFINDDGTLKT
jgi:hypothetical protein